MPPLIEATAALRVGDGLEDGTDVGPVISCAARDRIREWIERGAADGGDARRRRPRRRRRPDGASFVGPTILDDVTPEAPIVARRRSSARCSTVIRADSLDEAIDDRQPQPLRQRHVDLHRVRRRGPALPPRGRRPGMIGVNIGVAAPVAFFPFSGWKDSFLGDLHAHGPDAVEFYTRKKTVTSRWFSSGQGTAPTSSSAERSSSAAPRRRRRRGSRRRRRGA